MPKALRISFEVEHQVFEASPSLVHFVPNLPFYLIYTATLMQPKISSTQDMIENIPYL